VTAAFAHLASAQAIGMPLGLGGGGLVHFLITLVIWHEIWRVLRYLWHVKTFGPFIVLAIIAALIALSVLSRRGMRWRRRRGGQLGGGSESGPRNW